MRVKKGFKDYKGTASFYVLDSIHVHRTLTCTKFDNMVIFKMIITQNHHISIIFKILIYNINIKKIKYHFFSHKNAFPRYMQLKEKSNANNLNGPY